MKMKMGTFAGMVCAENPWFPVGMSSKQYYFRAGPPWMYNKARASPAQQDIWSNFARVAKASIKDYPADGTFSTLQTRVKSIGSSLRGYVSPYTNLAKIEMRVPISAVPGHPMRAKLERVRAAVRAV